MPTPPPDEPPPDEQLRALGRAIRRMRRERDLSQEAVAAAAGVHINQVSRLERGISDVYTSTMLRIVSGLGASLSELAGVYEAVVSRSGSARRP